MDYMFTFFEWHTQQIQSDYYNVHYCLWTICLLFLNDIHNKKRYVESFGSIVYGLYVYFFWMTYTTRTSGLTTHAILFMDYMFTFFEWHTQLSECAFVSGEIVYGLYVYFFWMTYTTIEQLNYFQFLLFMDYMFTFFEWHTQHSHY